MQGVENLFDRMDRMATHDPTFCDITWGAGGTTADLTLEIAGKMQNMVCNLYRQGRDLGSVWSPSILPFASDACYVTWQTVQTCNNICRCV